MPRKTKKTTIAKRGGTRPPALPPSSDPKSDDCCAVLLVGTILTAAAIAVGFLLHGVFANSDPEQFECYQHKEENYTVARVTKIWHYLKEVDYDIESQTEISGDEYSSNRERDIDSFNEKYEKLPNCDRYYYYNYRRQFHEALKRS